jgi:hypothetical protein
MNFGGSELVGLIVAVSFAAGLNVYATVATLGLLANTGLLDPANRSSSDNKLVGDRRLRSTN